MSYYVRHVFVCNNKRETPQDCCGSHDADQMHDYLKAKVRALSLGAAAPIRVSRAGCLGRCARGPLLVVYPEGIWYSYNGSTDLDEIFSKHLVLGRIVDRLTLNKPGTVDRGGS